MGGRDLSGIKLTPKEKRKSQRSTGTKGRKGRTRVERERRF